MNTTFADLGVPSAIAADLDQRGISEPFPIQIATIPDALAGRDLCGKAPTGSGKTIAFGIPMVVKVPRAAPKRPKGLVLTPTRELALQVATELRDLDPNKRVLAVYGGAGIEPQLKALRQGIDIVVACPGRLLDVIDRKACDLRDVAFVVVDEADRMADMGFLPDVRRILDQTSSSRQTLLFSATLDGAIDALVREYQHNPAVHEVASDDENSGDVTHHLWRVKRENRSQLTGEIIERVGPTVVFSRTRHGADRIAHQLERLGVSAAAIHGSRSQGQRERALEAFHHGRVKALVATDVAARGIHVEGVSCVVHFDLPTDPKDYVHRSGRTGRAGAAGTVIGLVVDGQAKDATKLVRQADVTAAIGDPAVVSLPEGHAAFKTAVARSIERGPSGRGGGRGNGNGSRTSASASTSNRKPRPGKAERDANRDAPRDHRTPRRDDRPSSSSTSTKPARSAKPSGGSSPAKPGSSSSYGKPRTGSSSPKATSGPKRDKSGAGSGRPPAPRAAARPDRDEALDKALAGSPKVRPSGASRRKARREALVAAGVDPASLKQTKRRR